MSKIVNKAFSVISMAMTLAACSSKQDFDATGTFEAETVTVSAETGGLILSFCAKEGEHIGEGELICEIDSTALVLQRSTLQQQQQALLAGKPDTQRQLSALKQQISKQQMEVSRLQRLVLDNAVPRKQVEDAESALKVLQSQYDATLSNLSKNTASIEGNAAVITTQIDQADYNISKCRVCAPVSGVVLVQYARKGEFTSPGKPIVKIGQTDNMLLRAYFTSDQLPRLKLGQKVKVVADFGADQTYPYEGTITWIASESEFTPKNIQTKNSRANLVYATKIAVKNDGRLKIGLYGEVIL